MPGNDKQIQDQTQNQSGIQANQFNTNQSQTQGATTSSATGPWGEATGLLTKLIGQYGALDPSVTGAQQTAANTLLTGASAIPQAGPMAWDAGKRLFSTDTAPQVGMLTKALADYTKNIGGTASGAELDPYATPGFSDAIARATKDITNNVKSVYAGSGRDPSGAGTFAGSLGRGLTEGIAPVIASQFNQNKQNQMNAAGQLYQAGGGTAGQITGQEQVPLTNISQGIGLLPQIQASYMAPGTAQAGAADYSQSLPFANLMKLLAPSLQLGGAGTQTSGTQTGATTTTGGGSSTGQTQQTGTAHGETTQPQSLFSNILGGLMGGAGILSAMGGSGGGMAALAPLLALSDRRLKTNIKEIGRLHDGQKVYKFRMKGHPQTHVGLMAQEVEKKVPDAVANVGGVKMVNYDKATEGAAEMGVAA